MLAMCALGLDEQKDDLKQLCFADEALLVGVHGGSERAKRAAAFAGDGHLSACPGVIPRRCLHPVRERLRVRAWVGERVGEGGMQ